MSIPKLICHDCGKTIRRGARIIRADVREAIHLGAAQRPGADQFVWHRACCPLPLDDLKPSPLRTMADLGLDR